MISLIILLLPANLAKSRALPLGGMRLLFPLAMLYPVSMVAAYTALVRLGAGTQSLPWAYVATMLVLVLLFEVLPYLEELARGIRQRHRAAKN